MDAQDQARLARIEKKLDDTLEERAVHGEKLKSLEGFRKIAIALFLGAVSWIAKLHFTIASK